MLCSAWKLGLSGRILAYFGFREGTGRLRPPTLKCPIITPHSRSTVSLLAPGPLSVFSHTDALPLSQGAPSARRCRSGRPDCPAMICAHILSYEISIYGCRRGCLCMRRILRQAWNASRGAAWHWNEKSSPCKQT